MKKPNSLTECYVDSLRLSKLRLGKYFSAFIGRINAKTNKNIKRFPTIIKIRTMSLENEKEVLIIHEYLNRKDNSVKSISEYLNMDVEMVKRVLKKYASNFNVKDEDIS